MADVTHVGDVGLAVVGHKVTGFGGSLAVFSGTFGWLAENHTLLSSFGVLVGITVGLYGLVLQRRRDKREQDAFCLRNQRERREHLARMAGIKAGE
ncbi:MAG: hypothetical protein AB9Q17_02255 [Candidatus Reddybacter sp.]